MTQADSRVTILINDKLVILKNDPEVNEKLSEIQELSERKDLVVIETVRENGVYPITDDQAVRTCTSDSDSSVSDATTNQSTLYSLSAQVSDDSTTGSDGSTQYKKTKNNGRKKNGLIFRTTGNL